MLERFDPNKPMTIDLETTNFQGSVDGLSPYKGGKIAMYALYQEGVDPLTLFVRSSNPINKPYLLPLEGTTNAMINFGKACKFVCNHNLKFDLRFLSSEGVLFPNAQLWDTMTLARLCRSDRMSYSLDTLTKEYQCTTKKGDEVKAWLKEHREAETDYGYVPHAILAPYAATDTVATWELYCKLINSLPPHSLPVWEQECKLIRALHELEHRGIPLDIAGLQKRRLTILQQLININEELRKIAGDGFNPSSPKQVDKFFTAHGINPLGYTDSGANKWDSDVLEQISLMETDGSPAQAFAEKLLEFKELERQESTFCAGWVEAADANGRIHPDMRNSGTKTGRLSSANPNVQNPPKWMMNYITIPDGYIGVKWDLAQIEYRIFAHYSKDPQLIEQYRLNPRIDYHQILADRLGLPRDPTKRVNFGILYGMGRKKTVRTLAAAIVEYEKSYFKKNGTLPPLRATLRKYIGGGSAFVLPEEGPISSDCLMHIASNILEEYHVRVPAVKELNKQVKQAIFARGNIRNFYGRQYEFTPDIAYIALNALIQGSAADFFKGKILEVLAAAPYAQMVNNIHDALLSVVPMSKAQDYWNVCTAAFTTSPFRVPILIDGEVAMYNWGNITKIQDDQVLESAGRICFLK